MRAAWALVLLVAACSPAEGTSTGPPVSWRSAAGQAMSTVRTAPVEDETCRQVLRTTASGGAVRFRLSNALGTGPLRLTAVSAGLRSSGAGVRTPLPVLFSRAGAVEVAAGGSVLTDPVPLAVLEGQDVAVSFAVSGRAVVSEHRIGAATGWCSGPGTGNLVSAGAAPFAVASREGLVVDDLQVLTAAPAAVLAVGDSLTDPELLVDTYPRWTDVLTGRLGAPVVNEAIAGNRVVLAGGYGLPLRERLDRDVLSRSGIGTVVILAGTNDVSSGIPAVRLKAELDEVCRRLRATGLRVVLATIPPAARRTAVARDVRLAVNGWIRTAGAADLVVDADLALRDPRDPGRLRPDLDRGDGLHLSPAGHRALAEVMTAALTPTP